MTVHPDRTGELAAMIERGRMRRNGTPTLPLGLHFGLPDDRYYADPGIGSTQGKELARNPQAYWNDSWMNPRRRPHTSTPSQIRGVALHRLVLFGNEDFAARYACGPNQDGLSTAKKATSTKDAKAEARAIGKTMLKVDDYERVSIAASMITKNPKLAGIFTDGAPEVSLFWEVDGIRCKARFDYIKHRQKDNVTGIGELKSDRGGNSWLNLDFPEACRQAIGRYAYHEQASWYMDAAVTWIPRYVAKGAVFGTDYDANWLERLSCARSWAWQWVFYGIEGAPLTWSRILSQGNPMIQKGRDANLRALKNYKDFLAHFGTEQWLLIEEPQELEIEEMPGWFR
jgi:hypothetical protein